MNYLTEWVLTGISAVLLMGNIMIYCRNCEFTNSDMMGAMVHWHTGFYLASLPLVIIAFMGHILPWWSGFIALVAMPAISYLVCFCVDPVLTKAGMIHKALPKKTDDEGRL
ncbi:MAG: hypothetical protein ACE5DZ_08700 [Mariprofundus sp.]